MKGPFTTSLSRAAVREPSLDEQIANMRRALAAAEVSRDEEAKRIRDARTLYGIKIVENASLAPNEIMFVVGSEVMGRIINLGNDSGNDTGSKGE